MTYGSNGGSSGITHISSMNMGIDLGFDSLKLLNQLVQLLSELSDIYQTFIIPLIYNNSRIAFDLYGFTRTNNYFSPPTKEYLSVEGYLERFIVFPVEYTIALRSYEASNKRGYGASPLAHPWGSHRGLEASPYSKVTYTVSPS